MTVPFAPPWAVNRTALDRLADIPDLQDDNSNLVDWARSVREALQTLRGQRGDVLDRAITARTAIELGLVDNLGRARTGDVTYVTNPPGAPGPGTPPDLTPPPTATGLVVTAGISHLFVSHDTPVYTTGAGHDRTVVYGAKWPLSTPTAPTFAAAVPLFQFTGTFGAYPVDPATRWCIWIKWQSIDGVLSVSPAGGTNGVQATTGQDVRLLLDALTAAAEDPLSPYSKLTLRGDLISVADNDGNATDLFNIVTTPITQNGVTVPTGVYMANAMIANGTITNAMIGNAMIDDAKIATLSAAKFTGGEMRVGSFLESTNYTSGTNGDGFRLNADGTAELQAAYIRGALTAGQINSRGLTILDPSGAVLLNAGASPSIAPGIVIGGTGGTTIGDLTAATSAPPMVTLTATAQIFVHKSGLPVSPATITVTATAKNIPSTAYTWSIDGVVVPGETGPTLTVQPFPTTAPAYRAVRCDASGGAVSAFDVITLYALQEGGESYNAGLDPENAFIVTNSTGFVDGGQLPITSRLVMARGAELLSTGVTYSVVAGSNIGFVSPTIDANTGQIVIPGINTDVAQVVFRATTGPGGSITRDAIFRGYKIRRGADGTAVPGPPGARGTVKRYLSGYSAWSNAAATASVPDGIPIVGDEVVQYNNTNFAETRVWNGSWNLPGVVIDGSLLVRKTVTASAIDVISLAALSADLGTVTAGNITGTANIDIAGSGRIRGTTPIGLTDPLTPFGGITTCSFVGNESGTAMVGVVGMTSAANFGAGVYGYSSSFGSPATISYNAASAIGGKALRAVSDNGTAVEARGRFYGVEGSAWAVNGVGVAGTAASTGGSGIYGEAGHPGGFGVYARNIAGGTALLAQGATDLQGPVIARSTVSVSMAPNAAAALVLPVVTGAFPPPIYGGVALHNVYGIILSEGTGWFKFNVGLTPV
jgi:hypothetical protein